MVFHLQEIQMMQMEPQWHVIKCLLLGLLISVSWTGVKIWSLRLDRPISLYWELMEGTLLPNLTSLLFAVLGPRLKVAAGLFFFFLISGCRMHVSNTDLMNTGLDQLSVPHGFPVRRRNQREGSSSLCKGLKEAVWSISTYNDNLCHKINNLGCYILSLPYYCQKGMLLLLWNMHLAACGNLELLFCALTCGHVGKDPTRESCAGVVCYTQVNTIALQIYAWSQWALYLSLACPCTGFSNPAVKIIN